MNYKLSNDLKSWRAERPEEWTMDRFIRVAEQLETDKKKFTNLFIKIKNELQPYKTNPTADHTNVIDHICAWIEGLLNEND